MSEQSDESRALKAEEIRKIVQRSLSQLMEHFEAVHIFVSIYDPVSKETCYADEGEGNYLARFGQVKAWSDVQTNNFVDPTMLSEAAGTDEEENQEEGGVAEDEDDEDSE